MTIRDELKPEDIRTDTHFMATFGNTETEISAWWLIRFLQERGKGWENFSVGEIRDYYRKGRATKGEQNAQWTFNWLIPGTHRHLTAQSFFSGGEVRVNNHVIEVLNWNPDHQLPDDAVCVITDRFIQALNKPGLLKANVVETPSEQA